MLTSVDFNDVNNIHVQVQSRFVGQAFKCENYGKEKQQLVKVELSLTMRY